MTDFTNSGFAKCSVFISVPTMQNTVHAHCGASSTASESKMPFTAPLLAA